MSMTCTIFKHGLTVNGSRYRVQNEMLVRKTDIRSYHYFDIYSTMSHAGPKHVYISFFHNYIVSRIPKKMALG